MKVDNVEFVITAPDAYASIITYDNSVRQTHGVLIDMFLNAKDFIILAAPYLKDLSFANPNLNKALIRALEKGVSLSLISTTNSFENLNIEQYKGFSVNLYIPRINYENQNLIGSHAKFCIVDGASVYLGSANFTFHGLNKNFEMGIYSEGKLANQVYVFWRYLCDNDFIIKSALKTE